jgi:hypothetical protein
MTLSVHGRSIDYSKLPKQLGRARCTKALYSAWRDMQKSVCSPALLKGMPRAIEYTAARIYDVEPHMVADAVRQGDSALFIAMLVRLSLIDTALVAAGRSIAERSPVIYAKHLVEGFKKVADDAFVELGGTPL